MTQVCAFAGSFTCLWLFTGYQGRPKPAMGPGMQIETVAVEIWSDTGKRENCRGFILASSVPQYLAKKVLQNNGEVELISMVLMPEPVKLVIHYLDLYQGSGVP